MGKMKKVPGSRYAYLALGLILLTFLVMNFNERMSSLRRLEAERVIVRAYLVQQLEIQVELERELEHASSRQIVEEHARVDTHKIQRGDHPIILVPGPGSAPQPTPPPAVEQPEQNNLERWVWLVAGPGSP